MKNRDKFPILLVLGLSLFFAIVFVVLQLTTGYPLKLFTTPTATSTIIPTPTFTNTPLPTETPTNTPLPTDTLIPSDTPTATQTPTETNTPAPTDTPTPAPLTALGTGNGFCRWGPDVDYLQSYVISENEMMMVNGRDWNGNWVWVQPKGLDWNCWVAASVLEFSDDKMLAPFTTTFVPINGSVSIPAGTTATRSGGQVTISWSASAPALEQHYLLLIEVCSNGYLIGDVIKTTGTSITVSDATNCSGPSSGRLYGVDKRGYSTHVTIPWP